jgi:hypothetical protein
MSTINYYLNEPVEIIAETENQYEIKYVDGWVEWVDQNEVTSYQKIKRSKIKKSNPKRKSENFKKYYGSVERVEWIKNLPCIVCKNTVGNSENVHIISKGSGGNCKHIVPMCRHHHAELHQVGIYTFQVKYTIDLLKEAEYYAIMLPCHQK